jgi:ketosteroid isomerase-like protein
MTSHEHPNVAIAREGMQASMEQNPEWFQNHLDDNVRWHIGGNSAAAGVIEGKDAVLQFFSGVGGGDSRLDLHDVMATDDHGVVLGVQRVSRGGQTLESNAAVVLHLRDGKATEIWVMTTNPYAEDEFFGS